VEMSSQGGLLHYAVQQANALAERGVAVDLITVRGNELSSHDGAARMRAILTPPTSSRMPAPGGRLYFLRRALTGLRLLRAYARLLVELQKGRYDAAVLHLDVSLLPGAVIVFGMTTLPRRPKLAFVAHNVRPFNRWGGESMFVSSRRLEAVLRRLFPRFDVVLVHGEQSRQELLKHWPSTRVAVVPHGDERILVGDRPPPPASEERALFFGDWRKVKGLPMLMDSFDQLASRRPQARLMLAGTPAPEDFDPDIVREWAVGHGGRVELIDRYVPFEDVREVFAGARVVVTPYVVGYQSGVVHLAMTMARPVVATEVGDLPAVVIDGETGLLVPCGDSAALAEAIERLVSDPDTADRLGAEGRRRVLSQSSWERAAEELERVLATLVSPRSVPTA
jgi:glycosyltransferase involved in cell wall biosynthesis